MTTSSSRPVFVTGASTGIGNAVARALAAHGHPVFATARTEADLEALAAIENVSAVRLDVRDPQQVRAAVDAVARRGLGLHGLVNNAGLGDLGMVSTWTEAELLDIFNVNVFGPFRVTNAFLPMLVESRGRVVLIGSQGGIISKKYYGPYTMTKHALEAYAVALRDELADYGVGVSIVQPGGIASNMGRSAFPGLLARFQRAEPPFKAEAQAVIESFNRPDEPPPADAAESETNRKPSPPEIVTRAVEDALYSDTPKLRYLVGTQWEGDRVLHALVEKLLDENDNPQHGYSREELVALLDRKIKERTLAGDS
jgi:NAD(P)-dependent dehydrogenase (short-subunit alcohol dehydrogenase family)